MKLCLMWQPQCLFYRKRQFGIGAELCVHSKLFDRAILLHQFRFFAIGAGVYNAKYDIFYNEHNGPYAETAVQKTFIGIDNASLAFTYKFDINRKGGKR